VLVPRDGAVAEIQVLLVTVSAAMVRSRLQLMHETSFITTSPHVISTSKENLRVVQCYAMLCQGIFYQDRTLFAKSLLPSQGQEIHHHDSISHASFKARDVIKRLQHLWSKILSTVAACSTAAAIMGSFPVRGRKLRERECSRRIQGMKPSMARGYRLGGRTETW
jgi:hypothetical protein